MDCTVISSQFHWEVLMVYDYRKYSLAPSNKILRIRINVSRLGERQKARIKT